MAIDGAVITLFLLDKEPTGRIKGSMEGRPGVVYKIPRTLADNCNDLKYLQQSGVYFLMGTDKDDNASIYIGQGGIRKNGLGVLSRAVEAHQSIDYWTEAIIITTSDDSFGPTEISFLENKFCNMAKKGNRYKVTNNVEPTIGNISEEKECVLEEFISYIKMIIGTMGYKIFDPIGKSTKTKEDKLITTLKGYKAYGKRTNDGFMVFKGSEVVQEKTASCPNYVIRNRDKYKSKIKNGKLIEDILFSSPSAAATFVHFASANGLLVWKRVSDGMTLGEIEKALEEKVLNS
ncbi:GIY-YIG nuclease family protein [Veillonella criceti]|uniref:DUF4357 domain-containing protein n=1 Tax=Veillonella criceti TaxID=103891 RepID=A0A380NKC5_9FIRM|nr:GIY-YIG nuclease family protein [Veillonella criceti]SUP41595.1 Uncharacterised protein [Veillonella criceti]SUP79514.1 Uncharacterised protein [Veillonella criceti]